MRELTDFLRFILPHATACPDPTAEDALLSAARDFCEATRCWRETDSFKVKGHDVEVVCVPPSAVLFEIEKASFDGRDLERVSFADARFDRDGPPRQITQTQPNAVRLAPAGPGTLSISMFLKPALDADVLPYFLFDQWGETLASGALARILVIPDQPFSNPQLAGYHAGIFQSAKDRNFNASVRGQQRAPRRSRSRYL